MAGQTSCGTPAMCVDTQTSSAHCGACDTACAMGIDLRRGRLRAHLRRAHHALRRGRQRDV
ncbi:MAG: hypothetical protein U0325_13695 [Polyangiales bacterium]